MLRLTCSHLSPDNDRPLPRSSHAFHTHSPSSPAAAAQASVLQRRPVPGDQRRAAPVRTAATRLPVASRRSHPGGPVTATRLSLLAVALLIGAAFIAAGPDEQAFDQSCRAFAPTAKACARL